MKSAPYVAHTYAQGKHYVERCDTGETYYSCATYDDALLVAALMNKAWDACLTANPPECEDEAFSKGFDAGSNHMAGLVHRQVCGNDMPERGDVETARPVPLARKVARAAKKKRDREEGGAL